MSFKGYFLRAGLPFVLGLALALICLVQIALAKGPADKITITGPGLEPIEITEPEALAEFSPWGDSFMDVSLGIVSEPQVARTYSVSIQVKPQWLYSFDYAPDPSGGRGYIHLPGPGDPRYQKNIGTLYRTQDGHWLYASASWEALMQSVLPKTASSQANASSEMLPVPGAFLFPFVIGAVAFGILFLVFGAALIWRARTHTKPNDS